MENIRHKESWSGLAVSLIGQAHVRSELPCQDASAVLDGPFPAAIVCDGVGSSSRSEEGAKAAVAAFRRGLGLFEPWIAHCLDGGDLPFGTRNWHWQYVCEWIVRGIEEGKKELLRLRGGDEKDYDHTLSFAVAGDVCCGFSQIGDGLIVSGYGDNLTTVFPPDKGIFANETRALRIGMAEKRLFKAKLVPTAQAKRIALTSDGPAKLLFDGVTLAPSRLFAKMFDDLSAGKLSRHDLCCFLTCRKWSEIGAEDDKSIALITTLTNDKHGIE